MDTSGLDGERENLMHMRFHMHIFWSGYKSIIVMCLRNDYNRYNFIWGGEIYEKKDFVTCNNDFAF